MAKKKFKTVEEFARAHGLKLRVPYVNTDKLIKHAGLRIHPDAVEDFGRSLDVAIEDAHKHHGVESTRGRIRPKHVRPYFDQIRKALHALRKALLAVQLPPDFRPKYYLSHPFETEVGHVAGVIFSAYAHRHIVPAPALKRKRRTEDFVDRTMGELDDWLMDIDRAEQVATVVLKRGRSSSAATISFLEFVWELYSIADDYGFKWTAAKDGDKASGSLIRAFEILRDDLPKGFVPRSDRTLLNTIDKVRKSYQGPYQLPYWDWEAM